MLDVRGGSAVGRSGVGIDPAVAVIRIEMMISGTINALIPSGVIWLAGVPGPPALGGADGLVQSLVKAAGFATLAMTLIVTNIVRLRMRSGGLKGVPVTGPARWLPRALLPRAIVLAIAAIVMLVPIGSLAALALDILPLSRKGLFLFNIAFGALIGVVMTPPLVRRALADLH